MNASQIATKTNLLRGTVKYRLRKLGYNTGTGVEYNSEVVKDILEFSYPPEAKKKPNYFMEGEVFFYWKENKHNSIRDISEHFNLPEGKVYHILKRVEKNKAVHIESKLNYTELNKL